MRLIC